MYLGNQPALSYTSFAKQDFTTSATTSYTLSQPVTNENEIALFINFVRQEPTTAYTASGTSLTLTSATSASDDMYAIFLGKAVQTVNPPAGSVGASQIADGSIALGKLSATGTKDSTTYLRGDNTFATVSTGGGTQEFDAGSASTPSITTTGDTNTGIFFPAADAIAFAQGGSELMRIKSNSPSGQVAIGTTGSFWGSRFSVDDPNPNATSGVGWGLDHVGGGFWSFSNGNTYWNNTSVGDAYINIRYKGNQVGSIRMGTSSCSFNTTSDYRLKNNISNVLNAIDRVKQLKPIRFSFIVEPDKIIDGFLAHEVQEVVPEAITGTKDATETYIDEQGNEQTKPLYQAIDQSKLVPLLTAGLQEAIAKIETLEARITALENK